MATYVDSFNNDEVYSGHLVADTSEELDAMANILGLSEEQRMSRGEPEEHFLLTPDQRVEAIEQGAIPEDVFRLVQVVFRKRGTVSTEPDPS